MYKLPSASVMEHVHSIQFLTRLSSNQKVISLIDFYLRMSVDIVIHLLEGRLVMGLEPLSARPRFVREHCIVVHDVKVILRVQFLGCSE